MQNRWTPRQFFLKPLTPPPPWIFNPCASMTKMNFKLIQYLGIISGLLKSVCLNSELSNFHCIIKFYLKDLVEVIKDT